MVNFINGHKHVTLFYDPDINRYVDGRGNIVYDIFRIITPTRSMVFKHHKHSDIVRDVTNSYDVTLIYIGENFK